MFRKYITRVFCCFVVFTLALPACKKDPEPLDPMPDVPVETVSASVLVSVTDEAGSAVSGALVTLGLQSGMTDGNGLVYLSSGSFAAGRSAVTVFKAGFFRFAHVFALSDNGNYAVNATLMPKAIAGLFNTGSGGTITAQNGGSVVFSSGNLVDDNGQPYSGDVNVAAAFVPSNDDDARRMLPNDFLGKNTGNEQKFLENHGVMLVELETPAGLPLHLASSATAQLSVPVSPQDLGSAPATLSLYYFDESAGYWKEDGTATLSGNNYVGTVSHFTFWMCPYVYDHHSLQGSLVCGGNGVQGVDVSIYNQWGSYLGTAVTQSTGGFSGMIPEAITFNMVVTDACGNDVYTQPIGPFSSNTTLSPVDLCAAGANVGNVTGYFSDCSGGVTNDAFCRVQSDGLMRFISPLPSGYFNTYILFCAGSSTASIAGVNISSGETSPDITLAIGSTMNFDTLQVCNTITEFCQFTLDGTNYYYTENNFADFFASLEPGDNETFLNVTSGAAMNETHFSLRVPSVDAGTHTVPGGPFMYTFVLSGNDGSVNLNVTFTSIGATVGDLVEGNVQDVTFYDGSGNPRVLSNCSFRFVVDDVL